MCSYLCFLPALPGASRSCRWGITEERTQVSKNSRYPCSRLEAGQSSFRIRSRGRWACLLIRDRIPLIRDKDKKQSFLWKIGQFFQKKSDHYLVEKGKSVNYSLSIKQNQNMNYLPQYLVRNGLPVKMGDEKLLAIVISDVFENISNIS